MKIACISDTHYKHRYIDPRLFDGVDIIIHAGDFTGNGNQAQTIAFLTWFESLPIKHKIFIAGNHDNFCESDTFDSIRETYAPSCHYLRNTSVTIEGIKFWGSPYSNTFGHWAFMEDDDDLALIWDQIPDDTNFVITHGPAYHTADLVLNQLYERDPHVGSMSLATKLFTLPHLKVHVCGHIHESYGIYPGDRYLTVNASICDLSYVPFNHPVVLNVN